MASKDQSSKPIHFFKIILPRILLEGKLRMPRKFVHEYGEGLLNSAFLKLPSGEEWEVNLEKCDGEVWFAKGWKKFADCYSLAHGHLLVFRYERPSRFQVLIFDTSALEIDYFCDRTKGQEAVKNEKFGDLEIGMLDENSELCRKKRCNSSISFLQPCKIRRTNLGGDLEISRSLPKGALHCTCKECKVVSKLPSEAGKQIIDQNTKRPSIRSFGAYEAARKFNSEYPFFKVIIALWNIKKRYMQVPTNFSKRLIKHSVQAVTLQVGIRSWRVKLIQSHKRPRSLFSKGWAEFARENALEVGDICFFELLYSDDDIVMKVSIFKHTSVCGNGNTENTFDLRKVTSGHTDGECNIITLLGSQSTNFAEGTGGMSASKFKKPELVWKFQQGNVTSERNRALERANTFQSRNPFVRVVMKASHIGFNSRANVNIPYKFAKKYFHFKDNGDVIFLRMLDGRVWTTRHVIRTNGGVNTKRYELSNHGWITFAEGNNLKVGDVCIFELINTTETTFQVFIYRNTDSPNYPLSREPDQMCAASKVQRKKLDQGTNPVSLNFQRASFSNLGSFENPCFRVKIGLSHTLRVPNPFMRKHIKHGGEIALQVGVKIWKVKLLYYDISTGHISAGWKAFLRENDLKVGDICSFELINREKNVMKVSISKHFSAE